MFDDWWRQMARGTILVAGLMSACAAPGRGVQARVPAVAAPAPDAAIDRAGVGAVPALTGARPSASRISVAR